MSSETFKEKAFLRVRSRSSFVSKQSSVIWQASQAAGCTYNYNYVVLGGQQNLVVLVPPVPGWLHIR